MESEAIGSDIASRCYVVGSSRDLVVSKQNIKEISPNLTSIVHLLSAKISMNFNGDDEEKYEDNK